MSTIPQFNNMSDKEIVSRLLSNDNDFIGYFFQEQCNPLLNKIAWAIFDNQVPIDELSNEFLCYLQINGWAKLRSFQFRSSLFTWLKVVAVRYFINNKEKLYPNLFCAKGHNSSSTVTLHLKDASTQEINSLLELTSIPIYHDILYMILINKLTDSQIIDLLSISETSYKRKKRFAFEHLKASIINAGPSYERLYLTSEEDKMIDTNKQDLGTIRETEKLISKIDVEALLNLIHNDRYRHVIRSLVLEDKERKLVAAEMGITIENLDNIKSRALKQLAEIARRELA